MPLTLPAPRSNLTATGLRDRATDVATGSTTLVTVGDYTAGAAEDMFTLSAHGLKEGDVLHVLWQSAMGAVTGGEATKCLVHYLTTSTFQVTDVDGTTIENTADGTVVFLKGNVDTALVELGVLANLIVASGDYTGGSPNEDQFTPAAGSGLKGLQDTDTLKLLYKSAAGVLTGKAADATVFAKTVTVTEFQLAATSGGAVIENTADGTAIFLKTS